MNVCSLRRVAWAAALVLLSLPLANGQQAVVEDALRAASENEQAWAEKLVYDKPKEAGKVSPLLREAAKLYAAGGSEAVSPVARKLGMRFDGEWLFVKLIASDEESAGPLRRQLRTDGGEILAQFHEIIFAKVHPQAIAAMEECPWLAQMIPQDDQETRSSPSPAPVPHLNAQALIAATQVDSLHAKGITGKGSKVGILESFQKGDTDAQHGAMVSAVVAAMAPDSEQITDYYSNDAEFIAAVDRLVGQGVQIINHSNGSADAPRNGNGLMDRKIREVTTQNNVLWVNSAGNEADTHWSFTRTAYSGGMYSILENVRNSPGLIFIPHKNAVYFTVTWDDWGQNPQNPIAGEDLTAFLFRFGDLSLAQTATTAFTWHSPPVLKLSARVVPGDTYCVFLYASAWPKPIRIHIDSNPEWPIGPSKPYCPATSICHPPAEDSVQAPGSAVESLTVGAVDPPKAGPAPGNYGSMSTYSSQGPTDEPKPKPDVSAYTNLTSTSLPRIFGGTSAAAPVVAGFAALLKQVLSQWTTTNVRTWIVTCADRQPSGNAGPNISGAGIVNAGRMLPKLYLKSGVWTLDPLPSSSARADSKGAAAALLDRLRQSASDPQPFEIKLALGRLSYRIGDGLKLGFASSEPAYFALFHLDGAGRYELVTSSDVDAEALQPGRSYVFPQGRDGQIHVTGPPGEEEFLLICSKERINWDEPDHISPDRFVVAVARVRFAIHE